MGGGHPGPPSANIGGVRGCVCSVPTSRATLMGPGIGFPPGMNNTGVSGPIMSTLGFVAAKAKPWPCGKPCPRPCPILPSLPQQGALMPVLYQPITQTTLASLDPSVPALYTLNLLATQDIDAGIRLRFQMWDGQTATYADAIAGTDLVEWDLILSRPIAAGTLLVASVRETGTALYGYTGSTVYASNGAGIPAPYFKLHNSLLCFAFAPGDRGSWTPAIGMPMFAIGFQHPCVDDPCPPQMGTGGDPEAPCGSGPEPLGSPLYTAPNFPDQYGDPSLTTPTWTFLYEVVYPAYQPINIQTDPLGAPNYVCLPVPGIKFEADTMYTAGSWTNARDIIAQPWTVITNNYLSVNNWRFYSALETAFVPDVTPDVGPFLPSLMPGQLVPVYWSPRYKDINTNTTPISIGPMLSSWASVGFLVTAPIDPGCSVFFTTDSYDAANGGFGPRKPGTGVATFLNNVPSFVWQTPGNRSIPAGTVVFIDRIGADAGAITIVDAHDSTADVGAIYMPVGGGPGITGTAVTCLFALGTWTAQGPGSSRPVAASRFVAAVLTDQYAGDYPPLSPSLTINPVRFSGQVIYGMDRVFDNHNLPGTVQCALINSATFTQLPWGTEITPDNLPAFRGMACFAF